MNGIETSSQEKDMIQKFKESEERLKKQNQILLRLAKSSAIDNGDLQAALKEITIAATEALNCDRSSVWIYNPEKTAIVCLNLFENSKNAHASGVELFAKDFPAYFKYLQEERSLAAHNAHTDPSTYEFSVVYLTPLGINSMLDA
ncbi:MAG: GAF domain-containing protein, partial [Leptospiraceae bacterium]|nr:GAF domain-containing protein [Leptospiraceae bacterium]